MPVSASVPHYTASVSPLIRGEFHPYSCQRWLRFAVELPSIMAPCLGLGQCDLGATLIWDTHMKAIEDCLIPYH